MFFVLFLVENLTVFNEKERRIALISCIVMTLCQFWHTHTIQVWGFNRLSSQRFCQNLLSNRRKSTSHFLFVVTAHSGLVGKKFYTMLKKVIFSVIAFAIGAMVSVSIQACADDYDEISRSNSSNAYSAWCNNGIVSLTTYDAQGQVSAEHKYTYNSSRWPSSASPRNL